MQPLTDEQINAFRESLTEHIHYVAEVGRTLGVNDDLLDIHDLSKWIQDELPHYARRHKGARDDPDGFAYAWLHHQNTNNYCQKSMY